MGMPITQRQHGRHQREFQRGREALADQARDLGALAQAQAELALRRIDQEVPELHEEGLVQPQVGAQLRDLRRAWRPAPAGTPPDRPRTGTAGRR